MYMSRLFLGQRNYFSRVRIRSSCTPFLHGGFEGVKGAVQERAYLYVVVLTVLAAGVEGFFNPVLGGVVGASLLVVGYSFGFLVRSELEVWRDSGGGLSWLRPLFLGRFQIRTVPDFWYAYVFAAVGFTVALWQFSRHEPQIAAQIKRERARIRARR